MFLKSLFVSTVIASSGLVAACDSGSDTPAPQAVAVGLSEYAITLSDSSIPAGAVNFTVTNSGMMVHEFVVLKTAFTPATLPVDADGAADEEATGVVAEGEVENVAAGATEVLKLTLTSGHYVVICNLGDHFAKGMVSELTVE